MKNLTVEDLNLIPISEIDSRQKASIEAFCCGENSIDSYLKKDAFEEDKFNITRTFLVFVEDILIGYFTVSTDRVRVEKQSKVNFKMKNHGNKVKLSSIPSISLHHFGIAHEYQGQGIGRLVMDAFYFFIINFLLPYVGACLITTYALKTSIGFYHKLGFEKIGSQSRDNSSNRCMALYISELLQALNNPENVD